MEGRLPGYSKLDAPEERVTVPKKKSFRALFKHVSSKHNSRNYRSSGQSTSHTTTSPTLVQPPHPGNTSSSSSSPTTSVRLPEAFYNEAVTITAVPRDFTNAKSDSVVPVLEQERTGGLDTGSRVSVTTTATARSTRSSSLSNSHTEKDRILFDLDGETAWCSDDLSRESLESPAAIESDQLWSTNPDSAQPKCDTTSGTYRTYESVEVGSLLTPPTNPSSPPMASQTSQDVSLAVPQATTVFDGCTTTTGPTSVNGAPSSLHTQEIDTVLTQTKVLELGHDVMRLEGAIRVNENQRKDLDDWLFDQMTAVRSREPVFTTSGLTDPLPSPGSAAAGIRSVYDEKMYALHKESKALHSRLEDTRYVLNHLEAQGFPLATSPKLYVQDLLRQRGKPRAPIPTSQLSTAGIKRDSGAIATTSGPQHHHHQLPSSYVSQARSIHTLPAQVTTQPPLSLTNMVTRLTKTLPAGGFPTEQVTGPMFTKKEPAQMLLAGRHSDSAFGVTAHRSRPTPQAPPIIEPSGVSSEEPGSETHESKTTTTTPGHSLRPSQSTRYAAHPTSPDLLLYQHHHTKGDSLSVSLTQPPALTSSSQVTPSNLCKPPIMTPTRSGQHPSNVLHSFRHGLENLGRRFPWSTKGRSVSVEHLSTSQPEKPPFDRSLKPSLVPNWPPSLKKPRKSKNHSLSSADHRSQQSPTSVPTDITNQPTTTDSGSQLGVIQRGQSYSISNSSTNGLIPPLPNEEAGTRSTSGWLTDETPVPNADQLLSRIFDLLTESTVAHSQPRGAVGSSGSSASVIGVPTSLASNGRSLDAHQQHCAPSSSLVPAAAVGQAFMLYHRFQDGKMTAVARQQTEYFRELRDELLSLKYQNAELHNTLNNVTAELDSIRRDVTTAEELHQQRLANALTRIEQLDANAENSKQDLHCALINLDNKMTSKVESLEYQLTTKTRDLDDNITSLSNKVSIIEKPMDNHSQSFANSSELSRCGRKVLHYLIDLSISLFALVTMLLQLLIRFLNLGAVITENRALAVFLTVLLFVCISLVYLSGPLLNWMQPELLSASPASSSLPVSDGGVPLPMPVVSSNAGGIWRNAIISFLNFFHRFVAR